MLPIPVARAATEWLELANNLYAAADRMRVEKGHDFLYERQLPPMLDISTFIERHPPGAARGYLVAPGGFGKTALIAALARESGKRVMVCTSTEELVHQTAEKFNEYADLAEDSDTPTVGKVYAFEKNFGQDITITTYNSLVSHTKRAEFDPDDFGILILDESHNVMGQETQAVLEAYSAPAIGFTASDAYSEVRRLEQVLPTRIHRISIAEAVEMRAIVPFRNVVAKFGADLTDVLITQSGEYHPDTLSGILNTPARNRAVIDFHIKNFRDRTDDEGNPIGRRSYWFVASVRHAIDLAHQARQAGINAQAVYGDMDSVDKELMQELEEIDVANGGLEVVVAVKRRTEGVDVPHAEVVMNVTPTTSFVRALQRGARSSRLYRGRADKISIVVDWIDEHYRRQPVLYADPALAGIATLFPSGRSPHDYDIPEFLSGDGWEVIDDPEAVTQLAHEFSKERTIDLFGKPKSWMTINAIASKYRVSAVEVYAALEQMCEVDEAFVASHAGRFRSSGGTQAFNYSPVLAREIRNYLELPPEPEPGELSRSQIQTLYGIPADSTIGISLFQRAVHSDPVARGLKRAPHYVGGARRHYGLGTQADFVRYYNRKVTRDKQVAYLGEFAPGSWCSVDDLKELYGEEFVDWGIDRVMSLDRVIADNHMLYRKAANSGSQLWSLHFSPQFIVALEGLAQMDVTRVLLDDVLADIEGSVGVDMDDIREIAEEVFQKYSGVRAKESALKWCDGRVVLEVSTELADHIRLIVQQRIDSSGDEVSLMRRKHRLIRELRVAGDRLHESAS